MHRQEWGLCPGPVLELMGLPDGTKQAAHFKYYPLRPLNSLPRRDTRHAPRALFLPVARAPHERFRIAKYRTRRFTSRPPAYCRRVLPPPTPTMQRTPAKQSLESNYDALDAKLELLQQLCLQDVSDVQAPDNPHHRSKTAFLDERWLQAEYEWAMEPTSTISFLDDGEYTLQIFSHGADASAQKKRTWMRACRISTTLRSSPTRACTRRLQPYPRPKRTAARRTK